MLSNLQRRFRVQGFGFNVFCSGFRALQSMAISWQDSGGISRTHAGPHPYQSEELRVTQPQLEVKNLGPDSADTDQNIHGNVGPTNHSLNSAYPPWRSL